MSVTAMIHTLAGSPEPTATVAAKISETPAECGVCGSHSARTADLAKTLGTNFTDRSMFRGPATGRVCTACLWCTSGKPPATLRMWTVVATPGEQHGRTADKAWLQDTPGLTLTSRADPSPVVEVLTDPPAGEWAVTVAVSGQKHVVPYATVNRGPGPWVVRMEATDVAATPDRWARVRAAASALRSMGLSAEQVRTGQPGTGRLKTSDDYQAWRQHAATLEPHLRSPLLDLALWTVTRGTP